MAYTNDQFLALLRLVSNSLQISELTEITSITTNDNYLVLNRGENDAQKLKIPLLRGVLGNYNASTNTPSLSNGIGLAGDSYSVSVAGSRDFGNGVKELLINDVLWYNGSTWLKLTQTKISDIDGLEDALSDRLSAVLSDEFYSEEGVLYSNISTYRQTINYTDGTQIFTLEFEPTFFIGIFVNGIRLDESEYIYTTPNTLEILGELEDEDTIIVIYEHFNKEIEVIL